MTEPEKKLYGADCNLKHWERWLAEAVARALTSGAPLSEKDVHHTQFHVEYWKREIARLHAEEAQRPVGWGSWGSDEERTA